MDVDSTDRDLAFFLILFQIFCMFYIWECQVVKVPVWISWTSTLSQSHFISAPVETVTWWTVVVETNDWVTREKLDGDGSRLLCRTPTDVGKAEIVSPSHTRGWRCGVRPEWANNCWVSTHMSTTTVCPAVFCWTEHREAYRSCIDHDHILSSWSMAANKPALLHPPLLLSLLINSTDNSQWLL